MAKQVNIFRWDGGIVGDPRDPRANVCRYSGNFDCITNPYKMIPNRASENADDDKPNREIKNFAIGYNGTDYDLYALGITSSASDRQEVLYKNISTGASTDLDDAQWATTANNAVTTGSGGDFECFFFYENQNELYFLRDSRYIVSYNPQTPAINDTEADLTSFSNQAQGLVHSKDDIAYIPVDNKIYSKNGAAAFALALTLPAGKYITSISEYGNFLAVAAAPISGIGGSIVYLWNRDDSLSTLTESIDFGEGEIRHLDQIEGNLVAIMVAPSNKNTSVRQDTRLYVKVYTRIGAVKTHDILDLGTLYVPNFSRVSSDNRSYFLMQATFNGTERIGMYSVGRNNPTEPFAIHEETNIENDTAISSTSPNLFGFIKLGDFTLISYLNSSDQVDVSKTVNSDSYTNTTAIRETVINPGMDEDDRSRKKQLVAVSAAYESLPSAGQVVVKYKVDGGSYVTIFTETTDNQVVTDWVGEDANGDQFTAGYDYEFRIESTGGAVITDLKYRYEFLDNR